MTPQRARSCAVGAVVVVVLATGPLTGCGTGPEGAAVGVATEFEQALGSGNGARACALLAEGTRSEVEGSSGAPCAGALLDHDLPRAGRVTRAASFGTAAQVRFADDVLFLGEFPSGWRVVAAGCTPVPGEPYDCTVQGG